MPYIKKDRKLNIAPDEVINPWVVANAGELNFAISVLIRAYIEERGKSYQVFNDIMGALEGAKAEFYRRVVSPYEDQKIKDNGDVY